MHSKDYFHTGMYTHQPRLVSVGEVLGNGGDEVSGRLRTGRSSLMDLNRIRDRMSPEEAVLLTAPTQ